VGGDVSWFSSSSSLPRVVETLACAGRQRLGDRTSERFLDSLRLTGHADELAKPMLSGGRVVAGIDDRIEYDSRQRALH